MTGTSAYRWLQLLVDPSRPNLPGRVAVVLAHPDDEVLGCGAILPRIPDLTVIHVTDGAPRDGEDARRHGFASSASYAAARGSETRDALAVAGRPELAPITLDIPDQGAAHDLAGIVRRLAPILAEADLVLTHAYEGGHPDHDATAFAVSRAAAHCEHPPTPIEMPFYRAAADDGWVRQRFESDESVFVLALTEAEQAAKHSMLAAHASQADTLRHFAVDRESYRVVATRDFSILPNGGELLYERYGWGLTGAEWVRRVRDADRDLAR